MLKIYEDGQQQNKDVSNKLKVIFEDWLVLQINKKDATTQTYIEQ